MSTPDTMALRQEPSQRTNTSTNTNTNTRSTQARKVNENHRPSISETLAQLHHDKKNQSLLRLNTGTHAISRRPIQHAPIASPFAGADVQKVVYVSSKTPLMAAVKRVRKFLMQIEKRATQDVRLVERGEREGMRRLAEAREKMKKEEVVVKASGRAMAKAVAVGRWFEDKETEWQVSVQLRGGSVSTVDDVVEVGRQGSDDNDDDDDDDDDERGEGGQEGETTATTLLEGGDTTMELLGAAGEEANANAAAAAAAAAPAVDVGAIEGVLDGQNERVVSTGDVAESAAEPAPTKKKRRKRTRKRRAFYDADDVPEQRLRWIKTVEVAISFKA